MNKDELLRICKAILTFRPTFMTVIKNLTQQDMILTERCLVRSIMVVFSSFFLLSSSPFYLLFIYLLLLFSIYLFMN